MSKFDDIIEILKEHYMFHNNMEFENFISYCNFWLEENEHLTDWMYE